MENLENDVKKAQLLSDEELKEVTGGGDPFAEALKDMRKKECDSAKRKKDCEKMDFCIWRADPSCYSNSEIDGACYYKG